MSLIQAALDKSKKSGGSGNQEPPKPILKNKIRPQAQPEPASASTAVKEPAAESNAPKPEMAWSAASEPKRSPSGSWLVAGIALLLFASLSFTIYKLKSSAAEKTSAASPGVSAPAEQAPIVKATRKIFPQIAARKLEYILNGVTTTNGERIALINNEIVKPGDVIGGKAVVKEILSRSVVLDIQGKEMRLSL